MLGSTPLAGRPRAAISRATPGTGSATFSQPGGTAIRTSLSPGIDGSQDLFAGLLATGGTEVTAGRDRLAGGPEAHAEGDSAEGTDPGGGAHHHAAGQSLGQREPVAVGVLVHLLPD